MPTIYEYSSTFPQEKPPEKMLDIVDEELDNDIHDLRIVQSITQSPVFPDSSESPNS